MNYQAGEIAGDYRILNSIGEGGMGAVYRVQHTISQRVEAIKVLLPNLNGRSGLEERFLREIQVQASLNHPNIASLHTAFRFRDQLLMVMEYVEGRSLRDLMGEGVSLSAGTAYVREVLAALGYAHSRGVVHRDVKPANILIASDGHVKLVDFGIASVARETRVTGTGVVVGSLAYMSPEQARGDAVDARSDIYSVGATLYEIATGELPVSGNTDFALIMAHQNQVPVEPAIRNPAVPGSLSRAIMTALEKRADRRFPTTDDFLRALDSGGAAGPVWDSAMLDRATRELAAAIGPIARVIVRREVKAAKDWEELRSRLAREIPNAKDRERFLAAVQ